MYNNNGTLAEQEFIKALDMQKFSDLNNNLKNFISIIFPQIDDSEVLHAEHCNPLGKPDIKVTFKGESHFVSLKSGTAEHVHNEQLTKFLKKIEMFHVPSFVMDTLKRFHYGDGTLDGTGDVRMSYEELFPTMISDIRVANDYLNESNDNIVNFVDTIVFKGNDESLPAADFLYHGNVNYGIMCSRKQVLKHLKRKNYDFMRNLHIGPIQFHPYARYVAGDGAHPFKRELVNFKWVNLIPDIDYIFNHYPL